MPRKPKKPNPNRLGLDGYFARTGRVPIGQAGRRTPAELRKLDRKRPKVD